MLAIIYSSRLHCEMTIYPYDIGDKCALSYYKKSVEGLCRQMIESVLEHNVMHSSI